MNRKLGNLIELSRQAQHAARTISTRYCRVFSWTRFTRKGNCPRGAKESIIGVQIGCDRGCKSRRNAGFRAKGRGFEPHLPSARGLQSVPLARTQGKAAEMRKWWQSKRPTSWRAPALRRHGPGGPTPLQSSYSRPTRKSGRVSGSCALPAFVVEDGTPTAAQELSFATERLYRRAIAQQRRRIDIQGASLSVLL